MRQLLLLTFSCMSSRFTNGTNGREKKLFLEPQQLRWLWLKIFEYKMTQNIFLRPFNYRPFNFRPFNYRPFNIRPFNYRPFIW